jgi:hypothetical protein
MMSEQTINKGLMVAGGLLSLGILGYLFFREKEEKTVDEADFTVIQQAKPVQNKQEAPVAVVVKKSQPIDKEEKPVQPDDNFPLKLGSKGKRVEQLQVHLLRNYGSAGIVTDDFDKVTEQRVQKFLKVNTVSETLFNELQMDGSKKKTNGTKKKY